MGALKVSKPTKILSLRNETVARRLGWTPESQITWREFLEQYPYARRELANTNRPLLSTAA
jgi:hypothetical protein